MEISNLINKGFKMMVIKMLTGLERRVNELSENFNKEIGNIKKEPIRAKELNSKGTTQIARKQLIIWQ